ncbi:isoprenyl transferase [Peribacillus sp. NPDC097264]|uniref:isoprenyl transferase n=1 Tax=unclassified Peribacillus TaxID=2675266 RepID=UPI003817A8DF
MYSLWKRFVKKDASSDVASRIQHIKESNVPQHIAIIMDGNGRWAKKRALPRVAGHHEGMKTVRKITKISNELGIKTLTVYAFSTENWKRPKSEVDFLMKLPQEFLGTFLPELIAENVRVEMMGDLSLIPSHTQKAVKQAMEDTKNNNGMILNFALNYGSRGEIVAAVNSIIHDVKNGIIKENVSEEIVSSYLMTQHLLDPDLLIRTSGEKRLSNFMLWQSAYTELWFTDVLWPDFSEGHLLQAVEEYQKRSRRFGGV